MRPPGFLHRPFGERMEKPGGGGAVASLVFVFLLRTLCASQNRRRSRQSVYLAGRQCRQCGWATSRPKGGLTRPWPCLVLETPILVKGTGAHSRHGRRLRRRLACAHMCMCTHPLASPASTHPRHPPHFYPPGCPAAPHAGSRPGPSPLLRGREMNGRGEEGIATSSRRPAAPAATGGGGGPGGRCGVAWAGHGLSSPASKVESTWLTRHAAGRGSSAVPWGCCVRLHTCCCFSRAAALLLTLSPAGAPLLAVEGFPAEGGCSQGGKKKGSVCRAVKRLRTRPHGCIQRAAADCIPAEQPPVTKLRLPLPDFHPARHHHLGPSVALLPSEGCLSGQLALGSGSSHAPFLQRQNHPPVPRPAFACSVVPVRPAGLHGSNAVLVRSRARAGGEEGAAPMRPLPCGGQPPRAAVLAGKRNAKAAVSWIRRDARRRPVPPAQSYAALGLYAGASATTVRNAALVFGWGHALTQGAHAARRCPLSPLAARLGAGSLPQRLQQRHWGRNAATAPSSPPQAPCTAAASGTSRCVRCP